MNNKKLQIENILEQEFLDLMKDMKNIQIQINVIYFQ
jgi:hypothetical protein